MKFKLSSDFEIDASGQPWRNEGLRIGIFGAPGSGKSYEAAVVIEQYLLQKGTVVIFQPRAEWHTLKKGFPDLQVVGGPYAQDMPFILASPKIYAEAVVKNGVSLIFYTGDVEDEEKLIDFVSKFIHYLLQLEETVKRPILLGLEEAQEYCPQSARGHIAPPWVYNRMVKAFKDCFQQGRKLGVNPIAISQRPQELNYTIRMLCNLSFYGKFTSQDIGYIDKECLKPYREKGLAVNASKLLDLKPGTWLVISGRDAEIRSLNVKRTTPHGADTPEIGVVASASETTRQTVSELGRRLQTILEQTGREKGELEKMKDKLKVLERDNADLLKKLDTIGTLQDWMKGSTVNPGQQAELVEKVDKEMTRLEGENRDLKSEVVGLKKTVETYRPFMTFADYVTNNILAKVMPTLDQHDRQLHQLSQKARPVVQQGERPVALTDLPKSYQTWLERLPKTGGDILRYVLNQHPRQVPYSEIALHFGMKTASFKTNWLPKLKQVPGWTSIGENVNLRPP